MTISGIDGAAAGQAAGRQQQMQQVNKAAADLFGMSQDDLRAALRGGQSLSDIASQKGISADQLDSTITSALQASGASAPAGTDLTQLAQKIAQHKGGGHHHHHHRQDQDAQTGSSTASTPAGTPGIGSVDVVA